MKKMICEICKSGDIIKQGDKFTCQSCGMSYSVSDAQNLLVEVEDSRTVEVQGTVKVDSSDEINKLYVVARRAKNDNNSETALKYYDMILAKDPFSWEACFYTDYFQAHSCKIAEIGSAAAKMNNSQKTVFKLIKDYVKGADEQRSAVEEVCEKLKEISSMLFYAQKSHFDGIDVQIRNKYVQEYVSHCCEARDISYNCGNNLIELFGETFSQTAVSCWKAGIEMHCVLMPNLSNKNANQEIITNYTNKIKKYDPNYQPPKIPSGGCYVATCVYGSYDCPEVWTLRRYRDFTLAETWYGRAFIRTYYAISPTVVKLFGETNWFKKIWRGKLDKMVGKLNGKGVLNTPYDDRDW